MRPTDVGSNLSSTAHSSTAHSLCNRLGLRFQGAREDIGASPQLQMSNWPGLSTCLPGGRGAAHPALSSLLGRPSGLKKSRPEALALSSSDCLTMLSGMGSQTVGALFCFRDGATKAKRGSASTTAMNRAKNKTPGPSGGLQRVRRAQKGRVAGRDKR